MPDSNSNTLRRPGHTTITENFYGEWEAFKNFRIRARFGLTAQKNSSDIFKPASHTDYASISVNSDDYLLRGEYMRKRQGYQTSVERRYRCGVCNRGKQASSLYQPFMDDRRSQFRNDVEHGRRHSLPTVWISFRSVTDTKWEASPPVRKARPAVRDFLSRGQLTRTTTVIWPTCHIASMVLLNSEPTSAGEISGR